MNALTRDLEGLTKSAEACADGKDRFRQKLHLMPPTGWLNDPNGLCQFKGIYHAFFQYSPFNATGGLKMWGHYTSRDMIEWKYEGVSLYPDQPFDCHGVYSGSAFIEDGKMYLYYTGNVKLEDGEFDYIRTGREANTVLVVSEDGEHFGRKRELMRNSDYPQDLTCHVRDPKVWKENGMYYMVQGARTQKDEGKVLIFESEDQLNWIYKSDVKTAERFGYMWECPDYFETEGRKILSTSVQGLEGGVWDARNVYQSGYFLRAGAVVDRLRRPRLHGRSHAAGRSGAGHPRDRGVRGRARRGAGLRREGVLQGRESRRATWSPRCRARWLRPRPTAGRHGGRRRFRRRTSRG